MEIRIEFYQGVMLLAMLLGGMFGAGRLLLSIYDQSLDERFVNLELLRKEGISHWDSAFSAIEKAVMADSERFLTIERDITSLKVQLAQEYVRREDHIITQSRLEAKLDGLADRLPPKT